MAKNKKWYVVWTGRKPGIYSTWEDCKSQVENFPRARYKSFSQLALAEASFQKGSPQKTLLTHQPMEIFGNFPTDPTLCRPPAFEPNALVVDAAFSSTTYQMEYKGVDLLTGKILFQQGPFDRATNNLGEFLAVVHALSLLHQQSDTRSIYTDSVTALAWVRKKQVNTNLVPSPQNAKLRELIERALKWLNTHRYTNKVLKWDTLNWGENPADFGRK